MKPNPEAEKLLVSKQVGERPTQSFNPGWKYYASKAAQSLDDALINGAIALVEIWRKLNE